MVALGLLFKIKKLLYNFHRQSLAILQCGYSVWPVITLSTPYLIATIHILLIIKEKIA